MLDIELKKPPSSMEISIGELSQVVEMAVAARESVCPGGAARPLIRMGKALGEEAGSPLLLDTAPSHRARTSSLCVVQCETP